MGQQHSNMNKTQIIVILPVKSDNSELCTQHFIYFQLSVSIIVIPHATILAPTCVSAFVKMFKAQKVAKTYHYSI